MMQSHDPVIDAINRNVNLFAAIKQYRHIKKVMADFTIQLQNEAQTVRVDQRIH